MILPTYECTNRAMNVQGRYFQKVLELFLDSTYALYSARSLSQLVMPITISSIAPVEPKKTNGERDFLRMPTGMASRAPPMENNQELIVR